ncbi:MAG: glutamine-hydrolyzing carbamoyl-phosphate synthase small subunit [Gammaproteobacteria bacterium]
MSTQPAILALADGTIFRGTSIGALGQTVGEVVFNTAMTGYQEILSDPSYAQQIVTLTYPHIGNVGVNRHDNESSKAWAAGLIIRDLSLTVSNWRAEQTLPEYLIQNNTVAIADIDTRCLTRILRDKGAQSGCILAGSVDEQQALAAARAFPGLTHANLADVVSTQTPYEWDEPTWPQHTKHPSMWHVVVYDYGVKSNILRLLVDRRCKVTVVPSTFPVNEVLKLKPDGILLSNGPGDPDACTAAIQNIHTLLQKDIPIFGICLGHQLLALAVGAQTFKMKFGHHGANHPVRDEQTGRVYITSQNHGFSVLEESLPENIKVTHRSLFDNTIQGFRFTDKPVLAFQGHPEASPGPHDIHDLFEEFIEMIQVA